MELAIKQAQAAMENNEVPVGAVLVYDDKVICESHNLVIEKNNPLMHAELIAILKGLELLSTTYLEECSLYVTKEPCIMCFGAIANARIRNVYFGAYDVKYGAMDYILGLMHNKKINHYPNIYGGIMELECKELLEGFFKCVPPYPHKE
jgi:tRNA(adenine34) deaminase